MKISSFLWLAIFLIAGGYLIFRTSNGKMGVSYVKVTTVSPEKSDLQWTQYSKASKKEAGEENVQFSWSRTIGLWVSALSTLAIFSFLYGDNIVYKISESIFIGASAGYAMAIGFWDGIVNLLLRNLSPGLMRETFIPSIPKENQADWFFIIPLILGVAMLARLLPKGGWIARWPLAFFIGATAGFRLVVFFHADFIVQIQSTILPLVVFTDGSFDWQTSLKNITIIIGVLSCLVYFFFSVEHTGIIRPVSRLGIWFLMITFGAGFGYTVMGRIALLAARLEFLFSDWLWLIDVG
jgi:hypothetical protein